MSEDKQQKRNIPELRFPEFSGEWEEKSLKEIAEKISKKNSNGKVKETFTNSAEFGIISQRDFFEKDISNERNLSNYFVVEPNDFVYNPRISKYAPVGPINKNNLKRTGVISPLYTVFRIQEENKLFISSYFKSTKWHRFMKLNGDSGARSDRFTIKTHLFMQMPIMIPSQNEQQKIGTFFSKLDRQIELEEKKLALLEEQKKGYMQKIFSQELRFKDENRNEYPEWVNDYLFNKINKIIDFRGKTPKKLGMEWSDKGFLALSALNVKNGYIDKNINTKYADQKLYNKWMGENKLERNQVVFTTEAPMGNVAQIPDDNRYILSQRTIAFEVKEKKMTNDFLAQLLRTDYVFQKLTSLSSGATAKGVSQKSLRELQVKIPSNIKEQYKIGNFLKKLDIYITKQKIKIESIRKRKKALLSGMLI